jgi:hypothetical protein
MGIVVKRCGGRGLGPEALMPVVVNGGLAGIDGPGSEIDECWEIDPDIWGAGGGRAYSYGDAGWFMNAGVGAGARAGTVTLEGGRVDIRTGGG